MKLPMKRSKLLVPLCKVSISAGFPSPAEEYMEASIDLNEELIKHPISTFFLRVSGNSMRGAGVHNGDLLIVDRSINPAPGHIVVAVLDGEFTLKKLVLHKNNLYLEAANPSNPPIDIRRYGEMQIWGVATYSIHSLIK
tara:strand:+ start:2498 stop:2914 length:417 start_codon:yes stop_codon:yes gene_type:complete